MIPLQFRHPTHDDAAMLLDWRTRPEITRLMFTDLVDPTLEKQMAWLDRSAGRQDFRHFVMTWEDRPVGYLSYDIDLANRRCSPGYYLVTEPRERWIGGVTFDYIVDYPLFGLGLEKIVYQIMGGNAHFIRAKRLLGVREVGVFERHVFKYDTWFDVHLIELTRENRAKAKRMFPLEQTLGAFPP